MNKLEIILKLADLMQDEPSKKKECVPDTFLKVGAHYLFRSVTMINTGTIVAINAQEILIKDACWIPETERWMNCVTKSIFKEIEPFGDKTVVLYRGAISDIVEIPSFERIQK